MSDNISSIPPGITASMKEFHAAIGTLIDSVKLLESFSGEYFVTLNQSGFTELRDIVEALNQTYDYCYNLVSVGHYEPANQILKYILIKKGLGESPEVLKKQLGYFFPFTANWSERFTKAVILIDKNIKESSKKFNSVGTIRKRTRNPTSMILGEVRRNIIDNAMGLAPEKKKPLPEF